MGSGFGHILGQIVVPYGWIFQFERWVFLLRAQVAAFNHPTQFASLPFSIMRTLLRISLLWTLLALRRFKVRW